MLQNYTSLVFFSNFSKKKKRKKRGDSPFCGTIDTHFWTSGDIYPVFQSKGGSLTSSPTCNGFSRFISGAAPADLLSAS